MINIALAIMRLPDNQFVFQRRDEKAPTSPLKLSFFGGHIEEGENADEAIVREIKEETSLEVTLTDFRYIGNFVINPLSNDITDSVNLHSYLLDIPSNNFTVYEGLGSEIYSYEQFIARTDVVAEAVMHLKQVYESLPSIVVFSGKQISS